MTSARFPKPAKRSTEERRAARRRKAKAARKAKPPGVKWLEHLADDLWSILIRATRDGCELAGYPEHRAAHCWGQPGHPSEQQCAHATTRSDRGTRFDPAATFALCIPCHRRHTPSSSALWHDWLQARLGAQVYAAMMARAVEWSAGSRKRTAGDLVDICRETLAAIREMGYSQHRWKEWAEERVQALQPRIRRALENTKGEP